MLITCEPMKDAGLAKLVIDTYGKYFRNIKSGHDKAAHLLADRISELR
jgi:hypothetical protein